MRTNYCMVDDTGSRFVVFADEVKHYGLRPPGVIFLKMKDGRFVHFFFRESNVAVDRFLFMLEWFGK